MEIKIQIDEEELKKLITDLIARKITTQYTAERNMFKNELAKATREVIYAEKDYIIQEVIHRAVKEVSKKSITKMVEDMYKGEENAK